MFTDGLAIQIRHEHDDENFIPLRGRSDDKTDEVSEQGCRVTLN